MHDIYTVVIVFVFDSGDLLESSRGVANVEFDVFFGKNVTRQ